MKITMDDIARDPHHWQKRIMADLLRGICPLCEVPLAPEGGQYPEGTCMTLGAGHGVWRIIDLVSTTGSYQWWKNAAALKDSP
jgi:hypothetical protein